MTDGATVRPGAVEAPYREPRGKDYVRRNALMAGLRTLHDAGVVVSAAQFTVAVWAVENYLEDHDRRRS